MSNVCTYCKETQQLGHYCQALLDMLDPCPWCRGPAVEWFLGTVCCADKDCPGFKALCSPEDWNRRATTPEGEALRALIKIIDGDQCILPGEAMMVLKHYGIQLPVEEGSVEWADKFAEWANEHHQVKTTGEAVKGEDDE